jgi:predicted dehydrogenase
MHDHPLRLGVIGCGLASKNLHWPALRQMPDKFCLTAVCNRTLEKAREFAQMVGVDQIESNYCKLIGRRDLDAVLVALPIEQNAAVVRDCLAAGKSVLCEKPLAHTLEEAKALRDFARHASPVLLVGENYYYREDFKDAKALIAEGRIGEVFLVSYEMTGEVDHTKSYGATPWRQIPAYRGGFVTDAGVHHAAALRLLGGEICAVQAFTKNLHPIIRADDNIVATLEFANGAIGQYSATYTAKAPQHLTRLRLYGSAGSLEITHGELWCFNPNVSSTPEIRRYPNFDNGFQNQWQAFYDAVCHGKTFPSTAEQCYTNQQIIWAMLDSASRREIIKLK